MTLFSSSRFGRLPVFIAAIAMQVFTGCVAAFIPWLWLFYILYFFQGAAQVAAALTGFVLGKKPINSIFTWEGISDLKEFHWVTNKICVIEHFQYL